MNTLDVERRLAEKYKYRPLPSRLSGQYRLYFKENTPDFLDFNGGGALSTKKGTPLCTAYRRIVVGDYGAFVEFSGEDLATELVIAPRQEWRFNTERYSNVKYIWLTVADGSAVKVYHQRKTVRYADYRPGMYYVSVHEVTQTGGDK